MPIGRPSDYSQELADAICERIADGESLRRICTDEDMPAKSTVFRWLSLNTAFSDQYAKAKEEQAESLFDEILDIADDGRNDYMSSVDDEGGLAYKLMGENIQRSRLRLDARKWMAGKLRPKKYGEKIEHEHSGSLNVSVNEMSDDDLASIAAGVAVTK